jgi:hypothetical protein
MQSDAGLLAPIMNAVAAAPFLPADPAQPLAKETLNGLRAAGALSAALAEISAYDAGDELAPTLLTVTAPDAAKTATHIYARAGRRGVIVWILRDAADTTPLELRLPGVIEGTYTLTWMNPADGAFLPSGVHQAPPQQVGQALPAWSVQTPAFKDALILLAVRENRW